LDQLIEWIHSNTPESLQLLISWQQFLKQYPTDLSQIKKIDFTGKTPVVFDQQGRKFSINFVENKTNYAKKKGSIKTELISKALGGGKLGHSVLDLSAGLGIDAIFLSQLGYQVTAVERNPVLFLALDTAQNQLPQENKKNINFEFASAENFLKTTSKQFDVIYFDPMFPEKKKSALPRQEMVLFRELVGADDDAKDVIASALELKKAKRVVVKRPLKAPLLLEKPQGQIEGKLIRFDIYGVKS